MIGHKDNASIRIGQDLGKVLVVHQPACPWGIQPPGDPIEVCVIVQVGANLVGELL